MRGLDYGRRAVIHRGLALALVAMACAGGPRVAAPAGPAFRDGFDHLDGTQQAWTSSLGEVRGAAVDLDGGAARLTLPSAGEIRLRHPVDLASVRGRRVRLSARVRTDTPQADAGVELVITQAGVPYGFPAREPVVAREPGAAPAWRSFSAVIDIDPSWTAVELALVLRSPGHAWFDDVALEPVAPPTIVAPAISEAQRDHVAALIRAVAVIRYRHPSDQAAGLDWDAFLPFAIDRVLRAPDDGALLGELRAVLAAIAPTVSLGRTRGELRAPGGAGTALVRWRHVGLGPEAPYASWREGRGVDLAKLRVDAPLAVDLRRCKAAQLRARVHGRGTAVVYARVDQPVEDQMWFNAAVAGDAEVTKDFTMPEDALAVHVGLELKGRSEVTLEDLRLICDGTPRVLDLAHAAWAPHGLASLYTTESRACGAGTCLTVARRPLETRFVAEHDLADVQLAPDLWLRVPLAVWSDGARTLPAVAAWTPPARPASDLAERLATVGAAWAIAEMFYPYFRDQRIDWPAQLPGALSRAAVARSASETFDALANLIAHLHDGHARPNHPLLPITGILPVALRRFGDRLIVVGALAPYAAQLPIGAEVVAIDRVPAQQAYAAAVERVSSATPGWMDYSVPFWLTTGPLGTWQTLRLRSVAGVETDVLLPRVSRNLYDSEVREPRPSLGATLAPGVMYVDLEAMSVERWRTVLPQLAPARALILDMRAYPGRGVWTMIGHLIDHAARSPDWQIPSLDDQGYWHSSWEIRPQQPRLAAKIVLLFDSRAMSAAETFLQVMVENHVVAATIGEPSAGTNGNESVLPLPGNFSLRFTGMRVPLADGTALQGHGIVPDELVHPTLEGVRAGRDELLEAAVARARALIGD